MDQAQLLVLASNILIVGIFWISALFTPVVSLYWPWWKHGIGRTVVAEATAMALVFLFPMIHVFFGWAVRGTGYQWFELACFAATPVIFVWRSIAIWRLQRKATVEGRG